MPRKTVRKVQIQSLSTVQGLNQAPHSSVNKEDEFERDGAGSSLTLTREGDALPSGSTADEVCDGDTLAERMDTLEEEMFDKSATTSSLTWEAYELSSDWNKSLKGDHGILAALDLSLPLPMCNIDSPSKHWDVLELFGDIMDLPSLGVDNRTESTDFRLHNNYGQITMEIPDQPNSVLDPSPQATRLSLTIDATSKDLDKSNMLMTPQELERMPDQGLEFEESVGPKDPPSQQSDGGAQGMNSGSRDLHIELNDEGDNLTAIAVMTSHGKKVFLVNTDELSRAATNMQPVIINANDSKTTNTLVMLPVHKIKASKGLSKSSCRPRQQPKMLASRRGEDTEKAFHCDECNKDFKTSYHYEHHKLYHHTKERPYKCSHEGCNWGFVERYKLVRHEKTHSQRKAFKCDQCDHAFSSSSNLKSHIKQSHDESKLNFLCDVCSAKFKTATLIAKHYDKDHPEVPKSYKCDEPGCDKSYHTPWVLERHAKCHAKRRELNLVCLFEGCGRKFNWKSRYDSHMRFHTGEKSLHCTFQGCIKSFASKSQLNRHAITHSDSKPFKCDECTMEFTRKDHLSNHKATHNTGVSLYKCREPGCKYHTYNLQWLAKHMRRHELRAERSMLNCPDPNCDETFSTRYLLLRHINCHHANIIEHQYRKLLTDDYGFPDSSEDTGKTEGQIAAEALESTSADIQRTIVNNNSTTNGPVAVLSTEVAGRIVELILPMDESGGEATIQSVAEPVSATLGIGSDLPTASTIVDLQGEKGSARTDRSTNELLIAQARNRQDAQKSAKTRQAELRVISIDPTSTQQQTTSMTSPSKLSTSVASGELEGWLSGSPMDSMSQPLTDFPPSKSSTLTGSSLSQSDQLLYEPFEVADSEPL